MKFNSEEELLGRLSAELENLDKQYADAAPPSLPELEQLIAAETARRSSRQRKDLLIFCIVALIVLSIVLAILSSAPVLYLGLQVLIPLAAVCSLWIARIRLRREEYEE
ncbi:YxlC family protein [Paenibacillus sp. MMS20-IR301]|uniref:YxlC family protein n=1 Tax=Paenibacillus sp. MMS20-IR301 TaxID=2895946 RepID=UPI0028E6C382|nr:YxlC family protein [Paenibacillus sp. MMS20-IR301]WNS43003.1 YxlC family protein [Paenibacillus sp. MMS20-IR301]